MIYDCNDKPSRFPRTVMLGKVCARRHRQNFETAIMFAPKVASNTQAGHYFEQMGGGASVFRPGLCSAVLQVRFCCTCSTAYIRILKNCRSFLIMESLSCLPVNCMQFVLYTWRVWTCPPYMESKMIYCCNTDEVRNSP